MQHVPEILKIIEGGLKQNTAQVNAYAELLASKLDKDGLDKTANTIRKKINSTPSNSVKTQLMEPALPVDKDSRLSLGDVTYPDLQEIEIQLPVLVDNSVTEFLSFIEKAQLLKEAGVGLSSSMLIYGPPGCGKTHLANYIAAKLGLPLITARCDTLISSFLGSTAKNIRSLFDHATSRPCVLFLDEFDAFAKARNDQHELGELKRVVVSLLQNIDALPDDTILLAATNHEELLDTAVWRRFSYRLQLPLPEPVIREKLIRQFLGQFAPKKVSVLVDITDGMSGAIIKQTCQSAIRQAIIKGHLGIELENLIIDLIRNQYVEILTLSSKKDEEKITILRKLNDKLFTVERLGKMFNMSTGKVSKLLRKSSEVNLATA